MNRIAGGLAHIDAVLIVSVLTAFPLVIGLEPPLYGHAGASYAASNSNRNS